MLVWTLCGYYARAGQDPLGAADLSQLSLEELGSVRVTTVSRKSEKLFDAPAAVYVISQEELRRSGVRSIPEALRMVPGLSVARAGAHDWAISARGFTDIFANKLLVKIDGRTVYSPLFSGVWWDTQNTVLEDVDRIEIVRGPGAALWGANAVNGVINIITKPASATQGVLVSAGAGSEDQGVASFRYGNKVSDDLHFRVFGKYFNTDDSALPSGGPGNDAWWIAQGGFRMDWEPTEVTQVTLQGDIYGGHEEQTLIVHSLTAPFQSTLPGEITTRGGNLLGRWTRRFSDDTESSFQLYYDHTERSFQIAGEERDTVDADFQHQFPLGDRQQLILGGGYRYSQDDFNKNSFDLSVSPTRLGVGLFNVFVQDEITLAPDSLRLTLGSKFEHNDFTGLEVQPSGRLLWTPHEKHTVWASISRAVRTPSRADTGGRIVQLILPPARSDLLPIGIASFGNSDFRSEELLAYEVGYRVAPHARLTLDAAGFYNVYGRLRSVEAGTPRLENSQGLPYVLFPFILYNNLQGETYGAELSATWRITDWWRFRGNYTFLEMQLRARPGSSETVSAGIQGARSPSQQFSLGSSMDLSRNVELDWMVRYVDALPNLSVRGYMEADLRLGWRPTRNLELALVGNNLLHARHREFVQGISGVAGTAPPKTEVQRSVFGVVTWRF